MTPERGKKIDELVERALQLGPAQRQAFLDAECGGEADLRSEVESLIGYQPEATRFLDAPAIQQAALMADAQPPALEGRTVSHYRLARKLGQGGMGEVYLAEDVKLNRQVAVKFLPAEAVADERAKKRLLREAQAAAKLDHPNICAIYEVAEDAGHSFIVMQYVEGETLAERIRRKSLTLKESLEVAIQAAEALAEAHSRGIIHRDIKPLNVMITTRGQVKVLDFGLAKMLPERPLGGVEAATESQLTEPGLLVGTVPYMSPEQARGEELDARSDIFSFGCVLYELVSGVQPFATGSRAATLSAILTKEPAPLASYVREVPAELEWIVAKALRKEREERYQEVKEVLADLQRLRLRLELAAEQGRPTEPALSRTLSIGVSRGVGIGGEGQATTNDGGVAAVQTASITVPLLGTIKRHKLRVALMLMPLLAGVAAAIYFTSFGGGEQTIDSIAVLPFANTNGDPNTEYLSDGIPESIINSLSRLPNLKVMSRNSVFHYKGKEMDTRTVAKELKVQAVLTGRVTQRGDGLSISVELVNAQDNSQIWGQQYDRKLSDLLAVQAELARDISQQLRLKLGTEAQQRLARRDTENPEAYALYLKGRFFWNKFNEEGFKKSVEYYNQAIAIDPNYALAYTGLSVAYNAQGAIGVVPPAETWVEARRTAQRAVELDDTLAEAHSALGGVKLLYEWDWPAAEKELKRAIELNPNYSEAHELYSFYFWVVGEFDKALSEIKRAQEISPISPIINIDLSIMYYYQGNYGEAINAYRKAQEMEPNMVGPAFLPGQIYERSGEYGKAIEECKSALSALGRDPGILSALGYVYGVSGNHNKAQDIINELEAMWETRYFSPFLIALAYTGVGNKDRAFVWLTKSYESRDPQLIWLMVEPQLESLHSDPRFADLLRRMGIPH